uniref:Uncharacterized protein n=1 Tax=viral metagenome TaxID=1070528 RepID=A0A6M3MD39_9ZZZZ
MSYALTGWVFAAAIAGGIYSVSESNTAKKTAASASQQAERVAAEQKTAEQTRLSKEEAGRSASKKMFREGLYFTSPGGTLGTGSRGSSRLMGK